jgi:hypothetical protein
VAKLNANQERLEAEIKAVQEIMVANLQGMAYLTMQVGRLASRINVNQEEAVACHREMEAKMDANQENMDAWLEESKAWRKQITACQEATEACL